MKWIVDKWMKNIRFKQMICLAGGTVCYLLALWADGSSHMIEKEGFLERPSYGQGEKVYELLVEGLLEHAVLMEVSVSDRQYTQEQAQQVFQEIMENLPAQILGENASFLEVRQDLNLITWLDQYGVKLKWESDNPEILDSFGRVDNQDIGTGGAETCLYVTMSHNEYQKEFQIPVRVYPAEYTQKEEMAAGFGKTLETLDKEQRIWEGLWLPMEYDGKQLHYREKSVSDYKILLVLGVLLAFLCTAKEKVDGRNRVKVRNQQMMLDYSEIVSKLMIFFGAGYTIPMAWERIVLNYEAMKAQGRIQTRYAYEELCTTYYQMKSGVPEGKAFHEFGRRTGLKSYLKLSSLLEQNRKTGTKNLRTLLDMEMIDAFEQRKNLAKRMGEEAGTKLLLPLFLMLCIVMVIIMVPAMLSF